MEIREVGALGCGLMGSGIAQVCVAFPSSAVKNYPEL
jgi:3-hydroxyacyl-CoA dehydrogenase